MHASNSFTRSDALGYALGAASRLAAEGGEIKQPRASALGLISLIGQRRRRERSFVGTKSSHAVPIHQNEFLYALTGIHFAGVDIS